MPTAALIDGLALGALLHWPGNLTERLPPALWLPADADDEASLVGVLGSSWETYQWCGLGTWFAPSVAPEPPAGFDDRYGDLRQAHIAAGKLTTPRGLRVRTEWSTLNPRSGAVHKFLTAIRMARGSGSAFRPWHRSCAAQAAWRSDAGSPWPPP